MSPLRRMVRWLLAADALEALDRDIIALRECAAACHACAEQHREATARIRQASGQ